MKLNLLNKRQKLKKIVRPERLELPTFRSGVESATNCAIAPTTLISHPVLYKKPVTQFAELFVLDHFRTLMRERTRNNETVNSIIYIKH